MFLEGMDNEMENKGGSKFLEFLISRKILTTFLIAASFIIITIVLSKLFSNDVTSRISNAYYISQIMSALFVVLGVVIALLQYVSSTYDAQALRKREMELHEKEILDIEKDRVQKAIDLSEYYKDNILNYISIIDSVYRQAGIKDILDTIKIEDMREFDQHELAEIMSHDKIEKILEIMKSRQFVDILVKNTIDYGFAKECIKSKKTLINKEGDFPEINVSIDKIELLNEYSCMMNRILNNMEYFAMHFTHKTADESVVYQSLHKTYIDFVRSYYYNIAKNNKPGEEKLFTNVIELFNLWKGKAKQQQCDMLSFSRRAIDKGTELNSIRA